MSCDTDTNSVDAFRTDALLIGLTVTVPSADDGWWAPPAPEAGAAASSTSASSVQPQLSEAMAVVQMKLLPAAVDTSAGWWNPRPPFSSSACGSLTRALPKSVS